MRLEEILKTYSPLKMTIRLTLEDGTEFRISRGFSFPDRHSAALTVFETWLYIEPSAIPTICSSCGEIEPLAVKAGSFEAMPHESVYTKGDYVCSARLTLSNRTTRSPLRRFLQTYGDNWESIDALHWGFKPRNVLHCMSLKAECAPLDK